MKSHAKFGRNPKNNTESDTKQQSHHGGIVIGAQIAGDMNSCPDSDGDNDGGDYRADSTGDDNIMGPARNIFRKSGWHFTDGGFVR